MAFNPEWLRKKFEVAVYNQNDGLLRFVASGTFTYKVSNESMELCVPVGFSLPLKRELFAGKRRIGEMLVELKHVFCCSEWTRVEETREKFTDMFTKSAESRDAISEGSSNKEDSPYLSWEGVRRRSSPRRHFVKVRESFK